MERARFIKGIECLAREIDSEHSDTCLEETGFTEVESIVFRDVVPEAFAVPVMEDLGVTSINEFASARNVLNRWVSVRLASIPLFVQALEIAREHRERGAIPQDVFATIAGSSALAASANKALNRGSSIEGASVSVSFLGAKASQLVSIPLYKRLILRYDA